MFSVELTSVTRFMENKEMKEIVEAHNAKVTETGKDVTMEY